MIRDGATRLGSRLENRREPLSSHAILCLGSHRRFLSKRRRICLIAGLISPSHMTLVSSSGDHVMHQQDTPGSKPPSTEPEIIPPGADWQRVSRAWASSGPAPHHPHPDYTSRTRRLCSLCTPDRTSRSRWGRVAVWSRAGGHCRDGCAPCWGNSL